MCLIHNFSGEDAVGNTFCRPRGCQMYSEFHQLFSEQSELLVEEPRAFEGKTIALLRGWLFSNQLLEVSVSYNHIKFRDRVLTGSFQDPQDRTYYHFTISLVHEVKGLEHLYFLKKRLVYCSGDVEMNPGPYSISIEEITPQYIVIHFKSGSFDITISLTSRNKARKKCAVLMKPYFKLLGVSHHQSFILVHHLYKHGSFNSIHFKQQVQTQVINSRLLLTSVCRQKKIPVEVEDHIGYFIKSFHDCMEDWFTNPENCMVKVPKVHQI